MEYDRENMYLLSQVLKIETKIGTQSKNWDNKTHLLQAIFDCRSSRSMLDLCTEIDYRIMKKTLMVTADVYDEFVVLKMSSLSLTIGENIDRD